MVTAGKRKKGQSLVEFALLLPLFLLMVVGVAEFGRAWMTRNILTGAAREGARVAAVQPTFPLSQAQGTARVNSVLSGTGVTPSGISVTDPGGPVNSIKVVVTSMYSVAITGFIPGLPGSFPLTGMATMRRERY
ncbi:MAG: TadE family protein [Candidatus Deferrimicrobiaceae bacterium]